MGCSDVPQHGGKPRTMKSATTVQSSPKEGVLLCAKFSMQCSSTGYAQQPTDTPLHPSTPPTTPTRVVVLHLKEGVSQVDHALAHGLVHLEALLDHQAQRKLQGQMREMGLLSMPLPLNLYFTLTCSHLLPTTRPPPRPTHSPAPRGRAWQRRAAHSPAGGAAERVGK